MVYSPYLRRLKSLAINFVDAITKVALSPQLFEDLECWSSWNRTHDLPHGILMFNKLNQPVSGFKKIC